MRTGAIRTNAGSDGKTRSTREEKREARRVQLMEATMLSLSKWGFSGTTLETVTKIADLSHGIVSFYFDSKEALYIDTLGYLAQEHYETWQSAMTEAGSDPASQLAAIVEADFAPSICSREKLSVWFLFWSQAKYRPNYLEVHSRHDKQRFLELSRLCTKLAELEGRFREDPIEIAAGLEALIDGLWLNLLLYPDGTGRIRARTNAIAYLARAFPKHFDLPTAFPDGGADGVAT